MYLATNGCLFVFLCEHIVYNRHGARVVMPPKREEKKGEKEEEEAAGEPRVVGPGEFGRGRESGQACAWARRRGGCRV